ncbi:MAG: hypothetical protein U9P07_00080 [Pseudomonadota bacterium]|nr:hypothetical protein [Pseudomonadota bacterium]
MNISPALKKSFLFLILLTIFSIPAYAQDHTALTPLLIKLGGWQAEKADGMSMSTGGMRMITANRTYNKGKLELNATVMVGSQAMTMGQTQQMQMETDDVRVKMTTIDGFKTNLNYDKRENSGGIMVFLENNQSNAAMFILSFQGMDENQALKLAKKFDWQAMKKTVAKLL